MKSVNTATPSPRETEPLIPQALSTRFVTLYGDELSEDSKEFINFLLQRSSHLLPRVIDAGNLTATEAVRRITAALPGDGHLLLCAHGGNTVINGRRTHHLALRHRRNPVIATHSLIRRIVDALGVKPTRADRPHRSLPFIYVFSCHSGALRQQISPGSDLWKRANLLIFASTSRTNLLSSGNSVAGAVAYVDYCQRNIQDVDPLKLLFFAGMHRGDCVTLMGGRLSAPLVWHAPKSGQDQSRIGNLSGASDDKKRFEEAVGTLRRAEYRLLPAPSLKEVLFNRITRNDAKHLEELLAAHPALRDVPAMSHTLPLTFAAETQSHDCLLSLLAAGADPDAPDVDGYTALMTSLMYENYQLRDVNALLKNGATVDLQNKDGITALMFACRDGHTEAIRMLLERGAKIDLQDINGETALSYACKGGHTDAVELLLKAKANANTQDIDGLSPLICASAHSHTDVILSLFEFGADANLQDSQGDTALTVATERKQLEAMRLLLENAAHPDAQRDDGATALMLAVDQNNAESVKLLLSKGARIDLFDQDGCSALVHAAKDNCLNVLPILLSAGASRSAGLNPALIELTRELGHDQAADLLQHALDHAIEPE